METKKYRSKKIAVNFKNKSSKLEWCNIDRKLILNKFIYSYDANIVNIAINTLVCKKNDTVCKKKWHLLQKKCHPLQKKWHPLQKKWHPLELKKI